VLLYEPQKYIADWAGRQLGIKDFGPCAAIGVLRNRELVAAAVFNHFELPDIQITFCTSDKRWATPDVVRGIISYPFKIGCKRITAVTDDTNQPAKAFLCRMGFRLEGIHVDASPTGGNRLSYGLLRKDAERWLTEEKIVGQRFRASAA